MELSLEVLGLLFLVAGVAGFIDAMAGGGGLLTFQPCWRQGFRRLKLWRPTNCKAPLVAFRPRSILCARAL
ncbi:Putative membrane protein YfcA [Vibrio cholerae LMA3984-4]|nr:Putative membrane protein YfcA [Vibrio cholerae LMA3984-4]